MRISKKEADEKKKEWRMKYTKKRKNIGTLATILSRKGSVRSAVTLGELVRLSKLSRQEVGKAINDAKYAGINITATEGKEPKYYWSK